jgi:hypothetical protein
MQANAYSKYALKDLHHSIALIDRRIVDCGNDGKFDSAESREVALQKLEHKRAALVKAALVLSGLGVTYDADFLSRPSVR